MDEIYNVISYRNLFIYTYYDITEKKYGQFVISKDKNDISLILNRLEKITNQIGFCNLKKDYYALHHIIQCRNIFKEFPGLTITENIYNYLKQVDSFEIMPILPKDRYMSQLDLCEFFGFMSGNKNITLEDIKISLNIYDVRKNQAIFHVKEEQIVNFQVEAQSSVRALVKLYNIAIGFTNEEKYSGVNQISARYELCKEYNIPGLNDAPSVFAQRYFTKLHNINHGLDVATLLVTSKNNLSTIALSECIPNFAIFKSDCFNKVVTIMSSTLISNKSTFLYQTAYNGITLRFGIGGLHGSVKPDKFKSSKDRIIVDIDITSMYATIATSLNIKPRHTSVAFIETMKEILNKRIKCMQKNDDVSKGKAVILKQVLNLIYGKTKEEGSVFYDPKYSIDVTIAAQLFMCKFLELLREKLNNVKFLMVNTDSITFMMDNNQKDEIYNIYKSLKEIVPLLRFKIKTFEEIYIKDINNYIGRTSDRIIAKGIFDYNFDIYKDNSAKIIPMAIKKLLFENQNIDDVLEEATIMDFTYKVKSNDGVLYYECVDPGGLGKCLSPIQNPSRYFYSKDYKRSGRIVSKKNNLTSVLTEIYPVTMYNTYIQNECDINISYYRNAIEDILSDFSFKVNKLF